MLLVDQLRFKVLAVFLVLALVLPMVIMPIGVAQAQLQESESTATQLPPMLPLSSLDNVEKGTIGIEMIDESSFGVATQLSPMSPLLNLDAIEKGNVKIEMIDGLPFIVGYTENKNISTPLSLPDTMDLLVNGVPTTIEVDENYLLFQTKEGIEKVCISAFCVERKDGQVVLAAEIDGVGTVIISGIGTIIGIIAGLLAIGGFVWHITTWLHDHFTLDEVLKANVDRWVGHGERVIVAAYNFNMPSNKDLKELVFKMNVYDIDNWEEVRFIIQGKHCEKAYYLGGNLPATGNDEWGGISLKLKDAYLDWVTSFFRENHGEIIIGIASDPDGVVWIKDVATGIDH